MLSSSTSRRLPTLWDQTRGTEYLGIQPRATKESVKGGSRRREQARRLDREIERVSCIPLKLWDGSLGECWIGGAWYRLSSTDLKMLHT